MSVIGSTADPFHPPLPTIKVTASPKPPRIHNRYRRRGLQMKNFRAFNFEIKGEVNLLVSEIEKGQADLV